MTDTARTPDVSDGATCAPAALPVPLTEDRASSLARTHAALADPVRLRLLSLLAEVGEVCSCDLVSPLGKTQPTISHHTRILAEAGLITGDKRGRWVHWSIPSDRRDLVRRVLDDPP